jgi:hypothetical protein
VISLIRGVKCISFPGAYRVSAIHSAAHPPDSSVRHAMPEGRDQVDFDFSAINQLISAPANGIEAGLLFSSQATSASYAGIFSQLHLACRMSPETP